MEFDKVNAFLATAIGGLIFKWLASGVSSIWIWLNKPYPEEDFLRSNLEIPNSIIRLSFCRYKISTKTHTNSNKIFLAIFGTLFISLSSIGFYNITNIIENAPIQWIDYTHKETKDSFWIKPGEAKNQPNHPSWSISPNTCINKNSLDKIISIKPETIDFICEFMLDAQKKDELSKETNKNLFGLMIFISIAYLSLFFCFMLGVAMFIDLYINKKITVFNKSEIERSHQYLT